MHSFLARTTSFHPKLLKSAMNVHHTFITTHSQLEFNDNVYNFVQSNAIKRNIYHEFEGELLVFLGGEKFQKFQKVSLYRESQHIIPPSCHKCYKYTFLPSVKVIIKLKIYLLMFTQIVYRSLVLTSKHLIQMGNIIAGRQLYVWLFL